MEVNSQLMPNHEHRMVGSNYGSCTPARSSARDCVLEQVNEAFDLMTTGQAVRTVIVHDDAV